MIDIAGVKCRTFASPSPLPLHSIQVALCCHGSRLLRALLDRCRSVSKYSRNEQENLSVSPSFPSPNDPRIAILFLSPFPRSSKHSHGSLPPGRLGGAGRGRQFNRVDFIMLEQMLENVMKLSQLHVQLTQRCREKESLIPWVLCY